MKRLLVLSPHLSQAWAVTKYLNKYLPEMELHAGFLAGEKGRISHLFKKVVAVEGRDSLAGYDMVLPTGAHSTLWLASIEDSLRFHNITYSKKNLLCFDKNAMITIVEELKIPIPETYTSLKAIGSKFPVFFKSRTETGEKERGIIYSIEDLRGLTSPEKVFFQEYIPGPKTYGMGFIVQKGEILVSFQHEEVFSFPIYGGSAVLIKRFHDARIAEYTKKIIDRIGFEGWGLAEYKYCPKRNDFVFMEVNAKLWASIEFAFINENLFLKHLLNLDYKEKPVNSVIFIDRLAALGWMAFIQKVPALLSAKVIRYQSSSWILKTIFSSFVSPKIRQFVAKK